jgi:hypothetical protein
MIGRTTRMLWAGFFLATFVDFPDAKPLVLAKADIETWNAVKGPAAVSVFNYAKTTKIFCMPSGNRKSKCTLLERTNSASIYYSDTAKYAFSVIYFSPDRGNALWFDANVFERIGSNEYRKVKNVTGLVGQTNGAHFEGNHLLVTTDTLKDGDSRCCPSGRTNWAVDLETGKATYVSGFADPDWNLTKQQ